MRHIVLYGLYVIASRREPRTFGTMIRRPVGLVDIHAVFSITGVKHSIFLSWGITGVALVEGGSGKKDRFAVK